MVKIFEPEKPSGVGDAARKTGDTAVAVLPVAAGVGLAIAVVGGIFALGRKLYNDHKNSTMNSGGAGQAPVLSFFGRRA